MGVCQVSVRQKDLEPLEAQCASLEEATPLLQC